MLKIRRAVAADRNYVWEILEPVLRSGETYALARDISREDALAYWFSVGHSVFVAEDEGEVVGTYYLRTNHQGGGSHIANCGYMDCCARDQERHCAGHVPTL